jgi:hypothetical protein
MKDGQGAQPQHAADGSRPISSGYNSGARGATRVSFCARRIYADDTTTFRVDGNYGTIDPG